MLPNERYRSRSWGVGGRKTALSVGIMLEKSKSLVMKTYLPNVCMTYRKNLLMISNRTIVNCVRQFCDSEIFRAYRMNDRLILLERLIMLPIGQSGERSQRSLSWALTFLVELVSIPLSSCIFHYVYNFPPPYRLPVFFICSS